MDLKITPAAGKKLTQIILEKGGSLAIRVRVRQGMTGPTWSWSLEPWTPEAILVDGVPLLMDEASKKELEGMVIDWMQTPSGPGLGVYARNLTRS
jgi:Fe-S cluster assembly iron-binding protein IscA